MRLKRSGLIAVSFRTKKGVESFSLIGIKHEDFGDADHMDWLYFPNELLAV